jgi:hypothetical protein
MPEIKPCPFCGGRGRVSAKDHLFGGYNGLGQGRREYLIRVICNKCKARGAPIATGWVRACNINSAHHRYANPDDKRAIETAEAKAIDAWNRRAEPWRD